MPESSSSPEPGSEAETTRVEEEQASEGSPDSESDGSLQGGDTEASSQRGSDGEEIEEIPIEPKGDTDQAERAVEEETHYVESTQESYEEGRDKGIREGIEQGLRLGDLSG
jgi:flagellar biosynthesis/type III secretory pathway protein FliH